MTAFFQWHINLRGLFNANAIRLEEQQWCYLTHSWEVKEGSYLSQGYLPEIERNSSTGVQTRLLRFQQFNHYTTRTPPAF